MRKVVIELTLAQARLVARLPGLVNPDDTRDCKMADRIAEKIEKAMRK